MKTELAFLHKARRQFEVFVSDIILLFSRTTINTVAYRQLALCYLPISDLDSH